MTVAALAATPIRLHVTAVEDPEVNDFLSAARHGPIFAGADLPTAPSSAGRHLSTASHLGMGAAAPTTATDNSLQGLGHGFADWLVCPPGTPPANCHSVGHNIVHFVESNLLGFVVSGVALYLIFAPDVAGTSRI
jgi:hypothetical protein